MTPGVVTLTSPHPVSEIVRRLQQIFQEKGIKLFAIVDHSGEAAAAGLSMPDTKLLIFGNPKAGTPVMLAAPSAALDLPLKILLAAHLSGSVLSWTDPDWLQQRHGFSQELTANLRAVEALAHAAAG